MLGWILEPAEAVRVVRRIDHGTQGIEVWQRILHHLADAKVMLSDGNQPEQVCRQARIRELFAEIGEEAADDIALRAVFGRDGQVHVAQAPTRRKPDVVEVHFVDATREHILGDRDVVVPDVTRPWIDPKQAALVVPERLCRQLRPFLAEQRLAMHRQLWPRLGQHRIVEHHHPGNHVQSARMEFAHQSAQVSDNPFARPVFDHLRHFGIEADAPFGVLDINHNGVDEPFLGELDHVVDPARQAR